MYEKIIVTGTPGTGKTSVAKKIGDYFKTKVIHSTEYIKADKDLIQEKKREGTK